MNSSLALAGALCAGLTAPVHAQKSPLSLEKHTQAHAVKRAAAAPSAVLSPPAPLVGGSDSCANPDPIAGTGLFAFDNSAATTGTEGQAESACQIFFSANIDNDVWFVWTAPASGTALFETCGITAVDTKMAAYAGSSCPAPGTALACSDDDCNVGLQSRVLFSVTSGNSYVLQLGTYPSAPGGSGQFSLSVVTPPAHDDCATPVVLSGFGRFTFDNSLAATGAQGQGEAACTFFGGTGINNDLWYTWVAPSSGQFAVVTEGLTLLDTKIAVYDGAGCPAGAAIGCNDDGGVADLQTITRFTATSGQAYTIQLGLFPFTAITGTGRFEILSTTPRPEDNCSAPAPIAGQGLFPFDNVFSTKGVQGQTEPLCNLLLGTSVDSDSWYLWTPDASGTATISTCPSTFMDTKIAVYPGPSCPSTGTALACDDDGCGPTGYQSEISFAVACGQSYLIQVGSYPYGGQDGGLGDLTISIAGAACPVGTPECGGDTAAACPCSGAGGSSIPNPGAPGNGCANASFPAGARLSASGNAVDNAGDTLVLTCSNIPGPGLFIQSSALVGPFVNFNDGILCAASGIIRMGVVFPNAGVAAYPGGLTPNPIHVAGAPVSSPTTTKHYQCWYRDVTVGFCNAAGHNMSNGLAIVWAP